MSFFIKELKDIRLSNLAKESGVIIGLDIGDVHVGVAVSDRNMRIATGVTTFIKKRTDWDLDLITAALQPYHVKLAVFGWPVLMNGKPGTQCEKVLDFIQKLHDHLPCDYAKWDERFSTKVVEQVMIEAGLSRKKRKTVIDKSAAVYILQGALDFLSFQN